MSKNIKWTYKLVKEYVESLGYILVSNEYVNNSTNLILKDNQGYFYITTFASLIRCKSACRFSPYNIYTIQNIKLWLMLNNKNYELITEIYNNKEKIILKDSENYLYEIKLSELIYGKTPCRFHISNSFTIENIKLFLKLNINNFELVSDKYTNSKSKIILKCSNGYYYTTELTVLLKKEISRIVHKSNEFSIQNIKLWCKLNNKPFLLLSDKYEGNNKKLRWQCLKENCGEIFEANWADISQGRGCPYCRGLVVGLSNCLVNINPEVALTWHPTKNKITPYEITANSGRKFWFLCKECGHEWSSTVANRNYGNRCPNCNNPSKGEDKIKEICTENNIKFVSQYKFNDCKNINPLPFDFYLSTYNTCIEYQGIQHYKPVDFAGKGIEWAEEEFKGNQIRDQIKRDYCDKNNIKLIEIPYWDFDNIEEILIKELSLESIENKLVAM